MKHSRNLLPFLACSLFLLPSCRTKTPKAVEERENWLMSLNDSIDQYQKKMEEVQNSLADQRERVGAIVGNFDYVNNPREVEGYYIYQGWKGRYPLHHSGIVARVTEDERFELIATHIGGGFNEIAVTSEGSSVNSAVMPHDQALNYRVESLNLSTVCFSGEQADSIGSFMALHVDDAISLTYLNGKKIGSINVPGDEKMMIAFTWQLYDEQKKMHSLEKELPRLSGKIAACRRMLEAANDSTASNQQTNPK